jgi:hypothetical protein
MMYVRQPMNGRMIMKTIQAAFLPPERSSRRITSEIRAMKIQIAMIQKKNRIEYQKTSRNVVSAKTIFLLSEGHRGVALPAPRLSHRRTPVTT